ncbi:MAG: DUF4144 family protein [Thalassotalea sp.]
MITWPGILKLDGEDELIYLKNHDGFISECHDLLFSDDDYVIDSQGHSYLIALISKELQLIKTDKVFTSSQVTNLIQAHEFKKASLCLIKIKFITISAAINSLAY